MSIVALVVLLLAGTVLLGAVLRAGARTRAAQEEFARARGWTFRHRPATGDGGSETLIAHPGEGWTVTLYSFSSSGSDGGAGTVRWTQFEDPAPATPGGLAILGPDAADGAAVTAEQMLGMTGTDAGHYYLDKLTGGLGDDLAGLQVVRGDGPGLLLATPGSETALDPVRGAPELAEARRERGDAGQPVVMRGPFGLRVRVARLLRKPSEIETFAGLGRALAHRLQD